MGEQGDSISSQDFRRLKNLIENECGISIAPAKRVMLETRLKKRARTLGLKSLAAYCDYIHTREGKDKEWHAFVDAITTHKTDFFREGTHFDYLINRAVPDLARRSAAGTRRPLLVWSSACSTGEEPYTLAMVLEAYASTLPPRSYDFRIYATDISVPVLETAQLAVYPEHTVRPIPEKLRKRYLLRSKSREKNLVRVTPDIRARVEFSQLNLTQPDYGFADNFDVVLCRNVMIYFDRPTQEVILNRISQTLRSGGYLFMGHSESLNGLELPLVQEAPTVYRKLNG
jgi:chemotaxis protein methyltransferase CheR